MKDEGASFLDNYLGDFIDYLGYIFLFPIHFFKYFNFENDLVNTLFTLLNPTIFWFIIYKVFTKIGKIINLNKSSLS